MLRSLLLLLWILAALAAGMARCRAAGSLEALEEQAFKQAVALAEPSIVRIDTVGGLDLVGDVLTGTGPTTGVVLTGDGCIITSSFNFVSQPAGIVVTLADGRKFPAEVAASDDARMLTLLRIDVSREAAPLIPLRPAPRDELRVGQWSIALGRTYDLAVPNLSVGILSGLNRVWGRAVQTDAKVSPANYGGPLVDLEGRGIGILVPLSPQKTEQTAGVEWYDGGIGFAIPLEDVYAVLDRLKAGETLKPGLLGVGFPDQGVLAGEARIDRVRPESPADKAGLREQDLIVAVAGTPIRRVPDLRHLLGRMYAGDVLPLTVQRGSETLQVNVTLAAELLAYESGYLGILPARPPVTSPAQGVEIREVLPKSPAALAGLQKRDIVTHCDGVEVTDAAALLDRIGRRRPGEKCELTYHRGGNQRSMEVTLEGVPDDAPESLPAASLPAPPDNAVPADRLGRANARLPGEEGLNYWRYVPQQYHPDYAYGLLVWLHPAGDPMEAAVLKAWQTHCDRRGLILIAPKAADVSGWGAGDAEFVRNAIEETQRQYRIDPLRIVLHGQAEGGRLAWETAFQHRDLVRGVMVVGAPLREPPPDNDPDFRLQTCLITADGDPLRERIEKSVEVLRKARFPAQLLVAPDADARYLPAATVDELAGWLDALDRI